MPRCYDACMTALTPIAAWLEAQRLRLGFEGPTSFAKYLGVSQSLYTRWTGKEQLLPGPVNLRRISRALGVDHAMLMRLTGHLDPPMIELIPHYGAAGATVWQGVDADSREIGRRFTLQIEGTCLMPHIPSGAWVVFDRERPVSLDAIVVAIVNGEWHVKRLIERNGMWTLADNDGRVVAPVEDVQVLGVYERTLREDE